MVLNFQGGTPLFQMVGAEWCEKCQKSIKILKDRGFWDKIEFIEIDQPAGQKLAAEFGVEDIPFFLVEGRLITYFGEFLHLVTVASLNETYGSQGELQ